MKEHRLSIGVAYHPYARTPLKFGELVLKFGAKIRLFQTVNRAKKLALISECCHTGTAGA